MADEATTPLIPFVFQQPTLPAADLNQNNTHFTERCDREAALSAMFVWDRDTTAGLSFAYFGGRVPGTAGTPVDVAAGAIVLDPSTTCYVMVNPTTGAVTFSAVSFDTALMPLYSVVTGSSTITTVNDKRTWGAGTGGGSSTKATNIVYGISKLSVAAVDAAIPIAVGDNDTRMTNSRPPNGAAGGDLGSTYPNPTVAKVQGIEFDTTDPTNGQVPVYNSGSSKAVWGTPIVFNPRGSWAAATAYAVNDTVTNRTSLTNNALGTYQCILAHTSSASGTGGNEPGVGASTATYWRVVAQGGATGAAGASPAILTSPGVPDNGDGNDGDIDFADGGNFYSKISGAWVLEGNVSEGLGTKVDISAGDTNQANPEDTFAFIDLIGAPAGSTTYSLLASVIGIVFVRDSTTSAQAISVDVQSGTGTVLLTPAYWTAIRTDGDLIVANGTGDGPGQTDVVLSGPVTLTYQQSINERLSFSGALGSNTAVTLDSSLTGGNWWVNNACSGGFNVVLTYGVSTVSLATGIWEVVLNQAGALVNQTTRAPSGSAGGGLTGTYPNPTLAAGAADDTVIGSRTGNPALATPASTGTLTQLLGWLMGRIKAISGETNWYDTPGTDLKTHVAATAAHGATGAVVGTTNSQTLTNKSLTTPTIASFANSNHDHSNSAGGGSLAAAGLPTMVGDSGSGGTKGAVPAPAAGDTVAGKFLKADATWAVPPGGGGSGTVTSVDMTVPAGNELVLTGNPITTSGTLALSWHTQSANVAFMGPTSGGAATPAFRALVLADLPSIAASNLTNGVSGSGAVVLVTSATLITPTIGAATATSINGLTLTASTGALTIPNGVTFTGPASSGTAMTLGNAEAVTGAKTFGDGKLLLSGATSGASTLKAPSVASTYVHTLPAATTTLVGTDTTDTLTNKTLTTPTIASFTNATHDHSNAAGGGALDGAAIASGTVGLTYGGTGQDLHLTGGAVNTTGKQFVKQDASHVVSVAAIIAADLGSGTGSSSNFLRGDLSWAAPAAAGAMTLLASSVLGADTANFDFTSISAAYNHLLLVLQLRDTVSATVSSFAMQFNADTGAHYYGGGGYQAGATTSNWADTGATSATGGFLPGATATAGYVGSCTIWIPNYVNTTLKKSFQTQGAMSFGTSSGNWRQFYGGGQWDTTSAAINEIKLIPGTNFKAGSAAFLYGVL